MTRHGRALEQLRKQAGLKKGELCRRVGWERPQYYRVCEIHHRGPTIATLDKFLKDLGVSWMDWARAYEATKPKRG